MTNGAHIHPTGRLQRICCGTLRRRSCWIVVVQGDESGLAVRDDQLEQSLFGRATYVGVVTGHRYCLMDHIEHTSGKHYIVLGVEIEDPFEGALSAQGIDYAGHFFGRGRRTFLPSARCAK